MRRRLRELRRRGGSPEAEAEIAVLRAVLEERKTLEELLASGDLSRCSGCGELVAKREVECGRCGTLLAHADDPDPHAGRLAPHAAAAVAPLTTAASSGRSPTPPAR